MIPWVALMFAPVVAAEMWLAYGVPAGVATAVVVVAAFALGMSFGSSVERSRR